MNLSWLSHSFIFIYLCLLVGCLVDLDYTHFHENWMEDGSLDSVLTLFDIARWFFYIFINFSGYNAWILMKKVSWCHLEIIFLQLLVQEN